MAPWLAGLRGALRSPCQRTAPEHVPAAHVAAAKRIFTASAVERPNDAKPVASRSTNAAKQGGFLSQPFEALGSKAQRDGRTSVDQGKERTSGTGKSNGDSKRGRMPSYRELGIMELMHEVRSGRACRKLSVAKEEDIHPLQCVIRAARGPMTRSCSIPPCG